MEIKKEAMALSILESQLAILTLTQPDRGNPIDGAFCRDFKEVMNDLSTLPGIRALLVRAEGTNFSVGGDIKSFEKNRGNLSKLIYEWTGDLHMGLSRFWKLPFPVIAEVKGFVMGGAISVMAGADMVVSSETAKLGSAFTQLGFSCDSGTSITLSMRMGVARARRFVMLGETLSAQDAHNAGLIDLVVSENELADQAKSISSKLAAGPTVALGEIRRLFWNMGSSHLESQLEDEAQTLARVSKTADANSALKAFSLRKKIEFTGN